MKNLIVYSLILLYAVIVSACNKPKQPDPKQNNGKPTATPLVTKIEYIDTAYKYSRTFMTFQYNSNNELQKLTYGFHDDPWEGYHNLLHRDSSKLVFNYDEKPPLTPSHNDTFYLKNGLIDSVFYLDFYYKYHYANNKLTDEYAFAINPSGTTMVFHVTHSYTANNLTGCQEQKAWNSVYALTYGTAINNLYQSGFYNTFMINRTEWRERHGQLVFILLMSLASSENLPISVTIDNVSYSISYQLDTNGNPTEISRNGNPILKLTY